MKISRLAWLRALLPVVVASLVEAVLGERIRPHVWFLFYPAIFVSSWIGDWVAGLVATAASTIIVWYFFIIPGFTLAKPTHEVFAAVVFFLTGVAFTAFHERLRRTNDHLRRANEERRLFAALVENSSDFIGIADAAMVPVYLNPAGRQMVGLGPEIPVEKTVISDYYTPDQRAFATNTILKSMVDRGLWKGDTTFRHWQTGEAIPVSDTHFIIRDPDTKQVVGHGTITRDITEIKRAQEEVAAATRKLREANDEIVRLYERTREDDELKTRFFAAVSHEFRTPLALILGSVEKQLGSPDVPPELRRDLQVIQRNAYMVLRHVNDLLDVARFEARQVKPDYAEIDAAALMRLIAGYFSSLAAQRHLEFVVETPRTLIVDVDADKLQRIVLNLLSNAFKFTPVGGRIRLSIRDADQRFIVDVADSGPGIPLDKRETVFERFRRLETPGVDRYGGTGLGLSIVRDLATLLRGNASIADAPEGGALFQINLPLRAPSGVTVRRGTSDEHDASEIERAVGLLHEVPAITVSTGTGAHGRVLVVEDNRDMSGFIVEILVREGFAVSQAFDGADGCDQVMRQPPDLLVTDIMMPGLAGDELIRRVRSHPELRSMPILVLTAKADDELRVRLLREGADDYLAKPFSPDELRARVTNLAARKRREDDVRELSARLDNVARASISISDAIAGLPQASVQSVVETVAAHARSLTNAEYAAVGIGGDADHPFDIWATAGISEAAAAAIGRRPRPIGLLGIVPQTGHAVRIADVTSHPAKRGLPPNHPPMTSFLGVPIRHRGQVLGFLYLANKRTMGEFTAQDEQAVTMLAEYVGVAVETARLYAAEGIQRAWLQAVVQQMPHGVMVMDGDGRITAESTFVRSLAAAGPQGSDAVGNLLTLDLRQPTGDRLSPEETPIVRAFRQQEGIRGLELTARRADGQFVPLLVSATPIRSASGAIAGAVMVLEDISVLKELEHLREEWASIVAHELRQPINAIVLRSDLLLHNGLSETQRRGMQQIRDAAMRLGAMTRDLLDASLLEAHRMRIGSASVDLAALVEEVIRRDPRFAARVRVHRPPDDRLIVRGDPIRLEQIVTNLVSNALKYGTVDTDIDIDVQARGADGEVAVTNRGPQIPAAELPFLFARYVRSRAASTSAVDGAGLGLFIAKGLVEAHGGRIWVESVPPGVTTFHFTIPLDNTQGTDAYTDTSSPALGGAHP